MEIDIFAVGVGKVDVSQLKQVVLLNKNTVNIWLQMAESQEQVFLHRNFKNFLTQINQLKVAQFECFDEFIDYCALGKFCLSEGFQTFLLLIV